MAIRIQKMGNYGKSLDRNTQALAVNRPNRWFYKSASSFMEGYWNEGLMGGILPKMWNQKNRAAHCWAALSSYFANFLASIIIVVIWSPLPSGYSQSGF